MRTSNYVLLLGDNDGTHYIKTKILVPYNFLCVRVLCKVGVLV